MLPDLVAAMITKAGHRLNAPTGAWCSLTGYTLGRAYATTDSQCTYRCVVLPDKALPLAFRIVP